MLQGQNVLRHTTGVWLSTSENVIVTWQFQLIWISYFNTFICPNCVIFSIWFSLVYGPSLGLYIFLLSFLLSDILNATQLFYKISSVWVWLIMASWPDSIYAQPAGPDITTCSHSNIHPSHWWSEFWPSAWNFMFSLPYIVGFFTLQLPQWEPWLQIKLPHLLICSVLQHVQNDFRSIVPV